MAAIAQPAQSKRRSSSAVRPSRVDSSTAKPFTLGQELEPFGKWAGDPIWVPPKDSSRAMAESMLQKHTPLAPRGKRWESVIKAHRDEFTQVRKLEMRRASIRLPKGKLFVSVTERKHFDQITDTIPACVQTRLDEFLGGPAKRTGAKVYYLKPLCIEVEDRLVFTQQEELDAAIKGIQDEVFSQFHRLYLARLPKRVAFGLINASLAIPREIVNYYVSRRQRAINAFQAHLEFKRRKTALAAARTHRKCRSHGCTFDEMLELTNPLEQADVIQQYGIEHDMSPAKRAQLTRIAAGSVPWFVTLSVGVAKLVSLSLSAAPAVAVCDPAFVAELPGSGGVLLKIGHFDEVAGVTHVEI